MIIIHHLDYLIVESNENESNKKAWIRPLNSNEKLLMLLPNSINVKDIQMLLIKMEDLMVQWVIACQSHKKELLII